MFIKSDLNNDGETTSLFTRIFWVTAFLMNENVNRKALQKILNPSSIYFLTCRLIYRNKTCEHEVA